MVFPQTSIEEGKKYYPLIDGSVYEFVHMSTVKPGTMIDTIRIEQSISAKADYKISTCINMLGDKLTQMKTYSLVRYSKGSLFEVGSYSQLYELITGVGFSYYKKEQLLFPFPLKVNQKWEYIDEGGKAEKYKVLKKYDIMTTDYGNFKDVIEVERSFLDSKILHFEYSYYAKDIGLIRVDANSQEEGGRLDKSKRITLRLLKSYNLNRTENEAIKKG
jgi:hypothetical protein